MERISTLFKRILEQEEKTKKNLETMKLDFCSSNLANVEYRKVLVTFYFCDELAFTILQSI